MTIRDLCIDKHIQSSASEIPGACIDRAWCATVDGRRTVVRFRRNTKRSSTLSVRVYSDSPGVTDGSGEGMELSLATANMDRALDLGIPDLQRWVDAYSPFEVDHADFPSLLLDVSEVAEGGQTYEIPANILKDYLETIQAQDEQIDAAWKELGKEPQDAPSALELAEAIGFELRRHRREGRERTADAVRDVVHDILDLVEQTEMLAGLREQLKLKIRDLLRNP